MDPTQTSIKQAQSLVRQVPLEDLVLILTKTSDPECLFVYSCDRPPELPNSAFQSSRLLDVTKEHLAKYDGMGIGLSAAGLLIPGLATRGFSFLELDLIHKGSTNRSILFPTMYRLARTLLKQRDTMKELGQAFEARRWEAEIIRLALPYLLKEEEWKSTVAVIPAQDLHDFLDPTRHAYDLIRVNDLSGVVAEAGSWQARWIVGFAREQVGLYLKSDPVSCRGWIELEPIMQKVGETGTFHDTCHQLAVMLHEQEPALRQEAYWLEASSQLTEDVVSGLVAFIPSNDFERFCRGSALRIYRPHTYYFPSRRRPDRLDIEGEQVALNELAEGFHFDTEFQSSPICFPVLDQLLSKLTGHKPRDLSKLLWQVRQTRELIRTLWLLSQDALDADGPEWIQANPSPAAISAMATRAAFLHGLINPWVFGSVQEYRDSLGQCYQHLNRSLLIEEQLARGSAPAASITALRCWYACRDGTTVQKNLNHLVDYLRENMPEPTIANDEIRSETSFTIRGVAEHLTGWRLADSQSDNVSTALSWPDPISRYMGEVANGTFPSQRLSPIFEHYYREYLVLNHLWQKIQEGLLTGNRPSLETLRALHTRYEELQRTCYGLAHEIVVLRWACARDALAIEQLQRATDHAPYLQLTLRNPYVMLDTVEKLHFDVVNIGGQVASRVQLRIIVTPDFRLESTLAEIQLSEDLAPGERRRVVWQIVPKSTDMILAVRASYLDQDDKTEEKDFTIPVTVFLKPALLSRPLGVPYYPGPVASGPGHFFGRRTELQMLVDYMTTPEIPTNVLLIGARRIGKTSLMEEAGLLPGNHQEQQRLGIRPDQEAGLRTIKVVRASLQGISTHSANPAGVFFSRLYQNLCESLGTSADEAALQAAFNADPVYTFRKQVRKILKDYPRLRPYMLLDEWDEGYRNEFGNLMGNLRNVMLVERQIGWIITSTWATIRKAADQSSPIFGILVTQPVGPMNEFEAIQLIEGPSESVNVKWKSDAILAAIDWAGCWPYLLQLICLKIVTRLRNVEPYSNFVDTDLVNLIVEEIIHDVETSEHYFGYLWKRPERAAEGEDVFEQINGLGRLVIYCLTEHHPSRLSIWELGNLIEANFRQRGLDLPSDRTDFSDELRYEVRKLEVAFGAIKEEKLVRHEPSERIVRNLQTGNAQPNSPESHIVYSIAVPMIRLWLQRVIAQGGDLFAQAHPEVLKDLERRQRKRIAKEKIHDQVLEEDESLKLE